MAPVKPETRLSAPLCWVYLGWRIHRGVQAGYYAYDMDRGFMSQWLKARTLRELRRKIKARRSA